MQFLWSEFIPRYVCEITRNFPDYYGLQYMDGGRMSLRYAGSSYILHGNYAWCVFPGPRFEYAPAAPEGYWCHRYVTFRGPRTTAYCAEGLLPFAPQAVTSSLRIGERMDQLRKYISRPDRHGQWMATNLLEGLLLELADARATMSAYPTWLPDLLQMLDRLLTGPIDYTLLAAEFALTEHSLRRQFKAQLGVPIHTYVLRKKMALACDLLRNSSLPIKEIAHRLGYQDIYFFHRQFRQYQGMPPKQYRVG